MQLLGHIWREGGRKDANQLNAFLGSALSELAGAPAAPPTLSVQELWVYSSHRLLFQWEAEKLGTTERSLLTAWQSHLAKCLRLCSRRAKPSSDSLNLRQREVKTKIAA